MGPAVSEPSDVLYRFRLVFPTAGVYLEGSGKGNGVLIPEGAELTTTDVRVLDDPEVSRLRLITVEWQGVPLAVFLKDLRERSERC
jgi:hypothetical protein